MINSNCHTHTTFCDGKASAEDMVKSAIDIGFKSLGFSVHCPMNFKNDYECPKENLPLYIEELNRLKNLYSGEIEIYTGIEYDEDHIDIDLSLFDYVIGAKHQLHIGDKVYYIDYSKECLSDVVKKEFNNDWLSMAKIYYSEYSKFIIETKPDVVAHFDLIEKFNSDRDLFDSRSVEYKMITTMYLEKICYNCPDIIFEVNTGAMFRCGHKRPYPAPFIMKFLKSHNMKITISSDSHSTDSLDYKFDEMIDYCKKYGYDEIYLLSNGNFEPVKI